MSMHFDEIAGEAVVDGVVAAEDILLLRGAAWRDGKFDPDEAEELFRANERLAAPSAEWTDFFAEALAEFVVNTVEPHGYVDADMAEELISRVENDGRVDSMAELELLVRVLEKATSVPVRLKQFALHQLETAVLAGEGPTRHGALGPGINAAEAHLLRRIVFSVGGDRPAGVSKAEAEMLFRIKDAVLHEANTPEWGQLFVQGVASFLLGFGGNEPLEQARAAELEAFMSNEGTGIGAFLGKMLTSKPDMDGAFGSLLKDSELLSDWDDQAADAARLDPEEANWLQDILDADEELDDLEKALIAFIDEETGEQFVPRPQG